MWALMCSVLSNLEIVQMERKKGTYLCPNVGRGEVSVENVEGARVARCVTVQRTPATISCWGPWGKC